MATGYHKGKNGVRIYRVMERVTGTLFGQSFWSQAIVSTVSLDEQKIRRYLQEQKNTIRTK